jgi:hypothetical protein
MKRALAGAGALALVGLGITASAAGAEEPPAPAVTEIELKATVAPNPPLPGVDMVITPDQPCTLFRKDGQPLGDLVAWVGTPDDSPDFTTPLDDKGNWKITVKAPTQPGTYTLRAECHPTEWSEEWTYCHPGGQGRNVKGLKAPFWGDGDCKFEHYKITFTIAAPTPPPATPIPGKPTTTG